MSSRESAQFLIVREGPYAQRHEALKSLIEERWGQTSCDIRECASCGFGFASPFIAGDAEFYNLAYPTVGYPRMKWEYEKTLNVLGSLDTRGKRALEVAAGMGFFLDRCVPALFEAHDVVATEFNTGCISFLKRKGYDVRPLDIRSDRCDDLNRSIDFLFLFQVLEHLDDIDALFDRIAQLLTHNGLAFIAVPNVRWINYREANGSLPDHPPTHIGRWTTRAFEAIASRHGLAVTDYECEPFSAARFIRDDLIFSHFTRAHRSRSLANRARSMKSPLARLTAEALETAVFAPTRVRALAKGLSKRDAIGGASLWVKIQRAA